MKNRDRIGNVAAEQKRPEEAPSNGPFAELDALYDWAPFGFCTFDTQYRYRRINEHLAKLNGIPVDQHINRTPRDIVPAMADQAEQTLRQVIETGQPVLDLEITGTTSAKSGVRRTWNTHWLPAKDSTGLVTGVSLIIEEITDRKAAVEALHHSERTLRTLMDANPESILLFDADETILFANSTMAERFGTTADKIVGRRSCDLVSPELAAKRMERLQEVVRTGKAIRFEDERDGQHFEIAMHPILNEEGQVATVGVLAIDQTEHNHTEEALKRARDELERRVEERTAELTAANEELQAIYGGMIDGLLLADLETKRLVRANATMCSQLGYSEEELLSMTVMDIHPPETVASVLEKFRTQQEGERFLTRNRALRRKDGSVFFADISNTRIEYQGRPCIIGLFRDVTERKLAEEALRLSEEKYRMLIEACPDAVVLADLEMRIVFASQQAYHFFRTDSIEELCGRRLVDFVVEKQRPRAIAGAASLLEEGVRRNSEYTIVRKDGTSFPCEVSTAIVRDDLGAARWFVSVVRDVSKLKHVMERLHHEHRTLKHLLQSSDHERQLIAYEIHDGLAQQLAGAIMQFQTYLYQKETNAQLAAKAYDAGMTMLQQGHFETRRLISGVRPPILDEEGVVAAIAHLVNEQKRLKGTDIEYRSRVHFDRLAPILENGIYRIAQEGLANACQHSESQKVRVSLVQRGDRIHLDVQDWGVGFDTKAIHENRFGLVGIRQRARLLGGKCSIRSSAGKGTRIAVALPVVARPASDGDFVW